VAASGESRLNISARPRALSGERREQVPSIVRVKSADRGSPDASLASLRVARASLATQKRRPSTHVPTTAVRALQPASDTG